MEAAVLAANREVAMGIVDLFAEHDQVSASVRMERLCYSNFVAGNPCIIRPFGRGRGKLGHAGFVDRDLQAQ